MTLTALVALFALLAPSRPAAAESASAAPTAAKPYSPYVDETFPTELLWGDMHVHSSFSMDANSMGNTRLGPGDAYRFAKGEVVTSNTGQPVRLDRPLDFLVVSDHAEYMGVLPRLRAKDPLILDDPAGRKLYDGLQAADRGASAMDALIGSLVTNRPLLDNAAVKQSVWDEITRLADQHDRPGVFSALIGFEWTSMPNGDNLHRVVVFADGADKAARMTPVSAFDGDRPEDLWAFLERYERQTGGRILAIPHNANLSNGRMFALETSAGKAFDRGYAETRARWEPVVEVTQIKGDGEAHPLLSPDDELADFETWDKGNLNVGRTLPKEPWMLRFEYAREALKLGLDLHAKLGINPFRFGMIGSTDAHTSLATGAENNFWGKAVGVEPGRPRTEMPFLKSATDPSLDIMAWQQVAAGYAAVWAKENTRAAIFDALMRREVYATSGPRIQVRFFGGFDFEGGDATRSDVVAIGYRRGVPMGSELPQPKAQPATQPARGQKAPRFLVLATKDPIGANLERAQIVKGWRDRKGELHEQVYDVEVAAKTGSTIDYAHATYTNTVGEAELGVVWEDPDFDPKEQAFYYARIVEIPTPRWNVYDEVRLGTKVTDKAPKAVQDRAYTSPIWFTPR
ncbi:DUF3604 domain-containing protein [Myxococcota bacterium]|nr:DUF3604 domain-containing protein [Myxococcota bacterium]